MLRSLAASMAFTLAGTGVGWTAPTVPRLLAADSPIPMSADESSWMVAMMSVGCIVAVIPLAYFSNVVGRKSILIFSAVPCMSAWLIIIFTASVEALYVARFLIGVEVIITFAITPIYLTEISEVTIRGILSSVVQLFYNVGALFEFSMGPYVSYRTLAISSAAFPVVFLLGMIWMPESPYFLLLKGRESDAEISLLALRGKTDRQHVQEELTVMRNVVDESLKMGTVPIRDLFMKRENRRALILIVSLVLLQQFCGQLAIVSYTTQILQRSASSLDADISVIISGGIQTVASVAMSSLVDRVGRKPLLMSSTVGLGVSTLGLAVYFYLESKTDVDLSPVDWIPITCLVLYVSLFSLSVGVLPFTIMGEIFLPNVKGVAASLALLVHSISGAVVTKLFQIMTDDLGADSPFWLFSVYCFASALFIAWYLPETKARTFAEIHELFNADSYPVRVDKTSRLKQNPAN
jgi:SP family facilitated glucose transporter-like MFS transporter 8